MIDGTLSGRRVLVIEDEMLVAMLVEDMLGDLGCVVVGAARIERALAMIEAVGSFDAAVLDVNIRGQKSYSVADALIARSVPFVFATGYSQDSLMKGYRWFPLLQKPFNLSELSKVLIKLLTCSGTIA